jgi:meso-butanediol dehydrogenase / (S,S)-butanediol dehydrogenase / diacetyl reductase
VTLAPERRALVTGGASGFGRAIARRLLASGARVALLDRDAAALAAATAELGGGSLAFEADVRDVAAVHAAVAAAEQALGGLDTLVVSAGVIHIKPLAEVSEEDWDTTLDINLKGAFFCMQAAAPALAQSGRGRIAAISSDAGHRGFAWIHAYSASKFGLIGIVEALAVELAGDGVTVNCVCPVGVPTTSMGQQVLNWKVSTADRSPEEVMAETARLNPLGRNASEADVAEAVLFLLSEEASFLTGVALDVDGGSRLGFIPGVA